MDVKLRVFSEFLGNVRGKFRNGLEDVDVRVITSNNLRAPTTREASDVKYTGVCAKRIVDAECRVALIPHPPHDGSWVAETLNNLLVSDTGIENVWPLELTVGVVAPPIEDVVSELWHHAVELTQRRLYDLRHEFLRHEHLADYHSS